MNDRGPKPKAEVVFVGRVNIDLAVQVPCRPRPGQTVFGSALAAMPGGKSLNQAVAAARLGGRVALVTNAGADPWGRRLMTTAEHAGVDVRFFRLLPDTATGAAIVEITPDGENSIILALSPATELTAADIGRALTCIDVSVVVVQLDIDPEAVAACLTGPRSALMVGNLIPHPGLDRSLLRRLDVLVVNQQEATTILETAGLPPMEAACQLRHLGPPTVVVTAGAQGAAYVSTAGTGMVPALTVEAVDTTGAGDAFLGCLAVDLARHVPLHDAVARAVRIGSEAVQHNGAQVPPLAVAHSHRSGPPVS